MKDEMWPLHLLEMPPHRDALRACGVLAYDGHTRKRVLVNGQEEREANIKQLGIHVHIRWIKAGSSKEEV